MIILSNLKNSIVIIKGRHLTFQICFWQKMLAYKHNPDINSKNRLQATLIKYNTYKKQLRQKKIRSIRPVDC